MNLPGPGMELAVMEGSRQGCMVPATLVPVQLVRKAEGRGSVSGRGFESLGLCMGEAGEKDESIYRVL